MEWVALASQHRNSAISGRPSSSTRQSALSRAAASWPGVCSFKMVYTVQASRASTAPVHKRFLILAFICPPYQAVLRLSADSARTTAQAAVRLRDAASSSMERSMEDRAPSS